MPLAQAPLIAKLLVENIVFCHGAPRRLLSDRGRNFLSQLVKEVSAILSIHREHTSGYHPHTNGLTERFNGTLAIFLCEKGS